LREYVKTAPMIELLTHTLHSKQRAGVRISLSKISTVSMQVSLGARTVWTNSATVEGGQPRLLWVTPAKPGTYTVRLRARDLAGNEASASGTIVVSRASAKHPRAGKASKAGMAGMAGMASAAGPSRPARRLPAL
jgi:hypothetical protein